MLFLWRIVFGLDGNQPKLLQLQDYLMSAIVDIDVFSVDH